MTELEKKYLGRKPRRDWKFFKDMLFAAALAVIVTIFVLISAVAIILLTPGVRAEVIESNEYYCSGILEGKFNISPADREEVTSYCNSL